MRVPKIIWKHNLLIHSSSSRAGDPVQWSNFPQQQGALEKKFSTTWSTLFCCSLWKSPLYFLSCPIQKPWTTLLVRYVGPYILRNHSLLTKHIFLCEKEIQIFGFACSFGLQFHLFWCSVAFHHFPTLSRATHYAREGRGGAFMQRKKQGGKSGIRFS